ncbi:hypothetical protein ABEB36_000865 [Hypothenemus hampei]|uniref:C2H2-type domain-containing protein n=1 Tax=Hypothenemus hampei TaxID=57062 RepID=A0ABD1FCN9_HYPHA
MSRQSEDSLETRSLIGKIVIYDKPNKPSVDTFNQFRTIPLDSGDIVFSNTEAVFSDNEDEIKLEFQEVADAVEIKEEDIYNNALEEVNEIVNEFLEDNSDSEQEESIENISKEISKSNESPKKKNNNEETIVVNNQLNKIQKPVKTSVKSQQSTILNFFTKPPSEDSLLSVDKESSIKKTPIKKSNIIESSPKLDVKQRRTRKARKRYVDEDDSLDEEPPVSLEEAPVAKRKKAAKREISIKEQDEQEQSQEITTENLDELINNTEEQGSVFNVTETDLDQLVAEDVPAKRTSPRKLSEKNQKQLKLTEMSSIKNENEEENEEDDYASDDSRKEWVPDEYAEYKRQHNRKSTNNKMHKCKFCSLEFGSYYSLRKHRALEHDDVGKDRKEATFEEEGTVEDDDSDEESRGEWMPQDYAEYKIKHSKMKRSQWYKCKICCAVFSNYYKLSKHKVEHETKSDPYECKQCEAKFKDVETFTAHIRVHQGKDPYKCKKCEEGFQTKEELTSHEVVHVLKKPPTTDKRFRCDICDKEFRKLCDIERHTRVHTGEKPCECKICHKRFQQTHNLSKHLLTHLHVRPFQCEICNKKFGRIDVLNRHLLTHSMEKPFKCGLCNKGFIRQVQLTNHMEKTHPDTMENMSNVNVTDEISVTPLA